MKAFPLIAAAAVAGVALLAPRAGAADLDVGAKFGINMSKVEVDEPGWEADSKLGVTIGAAVDMALTDVVSLQTGLQYAIKGSKYDTISYEMTGNILEIPVLARFGLAQQKAYALAGLNIGFVAKAELESGGSSEDVKDHVSGTNIDLVLGAGAVLADGKLSVGVQYELGLTDLNDDPTYWGTIQEFKMKNIQVVATYTF